MSDILNKAIVLKLNNGWQAIGHRTVRQAICDLMAGEAGHPPALALAIEYAPRSACELDSQFANSEWDLDKPLSFQPLPWEEWIKLPIRSCDLSIRTARQSIRVPTVLVARNYVGMPQVEARPTRRAIFQRDKGVCQYTGQPVAWSDGNLDHVIPRDRGGRSSFDNLVWSARTVNTLKDNRLPHEAGLRLLRKPKAPPRVPKCLTITEASHPDWRHFLVRTGG